MEKKKEEKQNSAGTNPSCAMDSVTWAHPGTSRILIGMGRGGVGVGVRKQKRRCEPWWGNAVGDPRVTFIVPRAHACREEGGNWER